jgi:ElaB/YqjD/DUF883 family membrane-anchored ribosome-binding protein
MKTETADISIETPEALEETPKKLAKWFGETKTKLSEAGSVISEKSKDLCKTTDAYVKENPWKTLGIAAGIGLFIGMLFRRRA